MEKNRIKKLLQKRTFALAAIQSAPAKLSYWKLEELPAGTISQ
jgi:hypothetical protein